MTQEDPTEPLPVQSPSGPEASTPERTTQEKPSRLDRPKRFARALKRRAIRAIEAPPEPEEVTTPPPPPPVPDDDGNVLTRMNPFAIGFFGTLGAMVAFWLTQMLGTLQPILLIVVVALFFALGLNPLVDWLTRHGLRRGLGVGLVALALLAIIGGAGWALVPIFSEQITTLVKHAPEYLTNLRSNRQIAELDTRFRIIEKITTYINGGSMFDQVFGGLVGAGRLLANIVFSLVVTLVLTLYFLASLPAIKDTIYRLAPASRRPRVRYLADEVFRRIGGYLSGMFIVVTCAGTAYYIFLMILGMAKYALALAVLVAICAFIPLVGQNIAMVLIAVVAFSTLGPWHGVAVLIFSQSYQQFDAYFLQPRVFRRSVDVPGPLVILSALAGGILLGVVGAILAIPTAAVILLLYREVLIPKLDRS
ncbi:AI-2E family transporter [Mariniluteicoccus endophyticus]